MTRTFSMSTDNLNVNIYFHKRSILYNEYTIPCLADWYLATSSLVGINEALTMLWDHPVLL